MPIHVMLLSTRRICRTVCLVLSCRYSTFGSVLVHEWLSDLSFRSCDVHCWCRAVL
jgi:hypothetical protein